MSNGLGYEPGPMGWVVPGAHTTQEMLDAEKRYYDRAWQDYPLAYQSRPSREMMPAIKAKWENFQADRGRFPGSQDLTLIDEFVFGKSFTWYPQLIGSCVWSNTFRRWFERMCVEICLLGDPEEFIGKTELGPTSLAPFCVSYGFARQRANMRGGDGLYCKPMAESLVKDGVVLCNTPKLKELMDRAGVNGEQNYPEVQPERLYRQIGDWAWNEALRPYTTCRLLEAPMVTTMDHANRNIDELKPMFVCSSVAIRKAGRHPDGFDIHTRDRGNSWEHNIGIAGRRVASDGERFVIWCNTSWLRRGTSNVEAYIYNMKESEFDGLLRSGQLDVSTIGDIDGIKSLPSNF